jgi:hypothetical protein
MSICTVTHLILSGTYIPMFSTCTAALLIHPGTLYSYRGNGTVQIRYNPHLLLPCTLYLHTVAMIKYIISYQVRNYCIGAVFSRYKHDWPAIHVFTWPLLLHPELYLPFGGPAVPEYRTTLEHFIVDPPYLCTVKNTYSCCHGSLLSAEKNRMSLSQIQLILESLEVEKPGFFHVRSLHCYHTLLKIIKHKGLYLINHNR